MKSDYVFGAILGLLLIALFILIGMVIQEIIMEGDIETLGQAICDQEYGLEFDYYYGDTLHCKVVQQAETYDGLKIDIGNQYRVWSSPRCAEWCNEDSEYGVNMCLANCKETGTARRISRGN